MKRPNYVRLNTEQHKDIEIDEHNALESWKVAQNCELVFDEIFSAASCFPIFFMKNPSNGEFMLTCIFSLRSGVNLFVDEQGWSAPYCPLNLLRHPFAVSMSPSNNADHEIYVDLDQISNSKSDAFRLFSDEGQETAILKDRKRILGAIVSGKERIQQLVAALQEFDLLSEMTLALNTVAGSDKVAGLYAIDHNKMKALSISSYQALISQNLLESIYQIKASTAQISRLIYLENKVATNAIVGFSLSANESVAS